MNNTLSIIPIDANWRKFKLQNSFKTDNGIVIPKGFVTDFASVPKIFWCFVSPLSKHGYAALEHDYLYSTALFSRKKIDKIFLASMKQHNVNFVKRYLIYFTVRIFGSFFYKNKK